MIGAVSRIVVGGALVYVGSRMYAHGIGRLVVLEAQATVRQAEAATWAAVIDQPVPTQEGPQP